MDRYYIPALGRIYERFGGCVLPMLRIVLGAILVPHGCQKLFGWFGGMGFEGFTALFDKLGYKPATLWVALVALTEVVGGLMLILGLFTRFAAAAVAIFMVNAILFTWQFGFFWSKGGWEYPLLLLAVSMVFLVRGGGELSIDAKMSKEL